MKPTRRDVVKGAAQAAPALTVLAAVPAMAAVGEDAELRRLFEQWRECWVAAREEAERCVAEQWSVDEDDRRMGARYDACRDAAKAIEAARAEGMIGVDIKITVLLVEFDDWIGDSHEALRSVLASLHGGTGSKYLPLALATWPNTSGGAA